MAKKILVVENNRDLRKAYKIGLELQQYEVFEACDGHIGLEEAISKMPDLVLTGNHMPCMNGCEMVKKLKADLRTSKIPIIGYGGFSEEQQRALDFFVPEDNLNLQLLY